MAIDDPLDQIDAQNPPPEPGGAIAALLNIFGIVLALSSKAAPAAVALQVLAFSKQFHDTSRSNARAGALAAGLREGLGEHAERLDELERRLAGSEAEEAVVVAVQRTINAARLERARQFGRIIGATAAQPSPNWQEATQFIRALEQLGDQDIVALRVLWRIQRVAYRSGDVPGAMSVDANDYTATWKEVLVHARSRKFDLDDWYSECGRLAGFGLVIPTQPNPAHQGPDATCYRLTGRAVRFMALLGTKVPAPYPALFYHPELGERTVNDEDEEASLGAGWYDTPNKFPGSSS